MYEQYNPDVRGKIVEALRFFPVDAEMLVRDSSLKRSEK